MQFIVAAPVFSQLTRGLDQHLDCEKIALPMGGLNILAVGVRL